MPASPPQPCALPCLPGWRALRWRLSRPACFNDGDTYWHIRAGEWMLAHHAVLRTDVFSYTRPGAPWHTQEWLSKS